jgi:hypothetical protein
VGSSLARVADQAQGKIFAFIIDRIGSFLIRAAVFPGVLVYQGERITNDHTAHANYNLPVAIRDKAGVGVKMKRNCVIDGSGKMSLPIPAINGLTLTNEAGDANKGGD